MYPTISLATHFRPNCKNSCIDNILTSEIDHVLLSGVLNDRIGDHAFIFTFTSIPTENSTEKLKLVRYYDYSSSKLTNFVNELEVKVNNLTPSVNFNEFLDCFNETLDKHCKLDEPKVTKRTPKLNPWITDGIIVSVERKHELCRDWSSTVTNRNPEGNVLLYKVFSDYRRMLKSIIKGAKRSYYCNEIYKNIENSKKTWQIINELRGRVETQLINCGVTKMLYSKTEGSNQTLHLLIQTTLTTLYLSLSLHPSLPHFSWCTKPFQPMYVPLTGSTSPTVHS